jgi:hypothetical protein
VQIPLLPRCLCYEEIADTNRSVLPLVSRVSRVWHLNLGIFCAEKLFTTATFTTDGLPNEDGAGVKHHDQMPVIAKAAMATSTTTTPTPGGGEASTSTKRHNDEAWWSVHPFRGMVNDIRRRAPYYVSDWLDAWDYRVVPATVFMYFAKYAVNCPFPSPFLAYRLPYAKAGARNQTIICRLFMCIY